MRLPIRLDMNSFSKRLGIIGKIRIHPLFVVLLVLAMGVGLWKQIVLLFVIVMLHEFGHALAASSLGYEVEEISLLPFGGVAKLSHGGIGFTPKHEAFIAIAGPAVNLMLAVLAWVLNITGVWSDSFFETMVQLNLWIAIFNLLPGLPLDGGRILRAARSRSVGFEAATEEAYSMSIVIAAILLALGAASLWAGAPHVGAIILGIFLLVSSFTGRRDIRMETIRFLDTKKHRSRRTTEQVRALAAPASACIKDVVKQFSPDRYHMVYVLNSDAVVQTVIEEDEVLQAVFEGLWLESLDSWLKR